MIRVIVYIYRIAFLNVKYWLGSDDLLLEDGNGSYMDYALTVTWNSHSYIRICKQFREKFLHFFQLSKMFLC